MARTFFLAAAAISLGVIGLGTAPLPARAQTAPGRFASAPVFGASGQASTVFLGGSVDDLESASVAAGASGVWAQDAAGAFQLLVVGGPRFVSDGFRAAFPAGFTRAAAVTLTQAAAPATAAPAAPASPSVPTQPSLPAAPPPAASTPATTASAARWTAAAAPAGATVGGGEWISIEAPDGKAILAQVFRPAGDGPFPAVVLLHGQAGFSNTFLTTGAEISRAGFVTVVGCWFAGNYIGTSNAESPTPTTTPDGIACPNGPALKPMTSTAAVDDVAALVAATRTLPGVRSGRVALVGNSRGSITTLLAAGLAADRPEVLAAIAGAPPGAAVLALSITQPLLLLQGEADTVLPVSNSRALESALRLLGRPVQSHYYAGAPHEFFFDAQWHADALSRLTTFLQASLTP